MKLTKVISTKIQNFKLIVKILRYGKKDAHTSNVSTPYGIDSNPIKDMIALQVQTSMNDTVIVGYINKNAVADVGELRLYSTDSAGNEKTFVHLKNDGNIDFLGNGNNLVSYNDLVTQFNELKDNYNILVGKLNAWVVVPNDGGGALKTALSVTPAVSVSNADITKTKVDYLNIK